MSRKTFFTLFIVISLLGILARLYQLEPRPLHNDEAVNHFFLQGIDERGYYEYSHENYHGPSYFYLTYYLWKLIADNEIGVRASVVVISALTPLLLLPLISYIGYLTVIVATILITLSPSLFYYSRYAIHEPLFIFATLGLSINALIWWLEGGRRHLCAAFIFLALLIATKETFIITIFSIGIAFIALSLYKLTLYKEVFFRLLSDRRVVYLAMIFAMAIIWILFSAAGKHEKGLEEMYLAIPQWIGRNDSDYGHFKPYDYYFGIIMRQEIYLLIVPILLLCDAILILLDYFGILNKMEAVRSREFSKLAILFFAVWGLVAMAVYSWLNYKTPWLIMNFTAPLNIAFALYLVRYARLLEPFFQRSATLITSPILAIIVLYLVNGIYRTSYKQSYGPGNDYSYVHSTAGAVELSKKILEYAAYKQDLKVLIGIDGYWPIPFYLRSLKGRVFYSKIDEPAQISDEFDVLVLELNIPIDRADWQSEYYRVSDAEEAHLVYVKR
jgi:uncharacterized protein (TIGR03663 family)